MKRVSGDIAFSYQTALYAMNVAKEWLRPHVGDWGSAAVVSDSQAMLRAMRGGVLGI